jgi:hypothetical protein
MAPEQDIQPFIALPANIGTERFNLKIPCLLQIQNWKGKVEYVSLCHEFKFLTTVYITDL